MSFGRSPSANSLDSTAGFVSLVRNKKNGDDGSSDPPPPLTFSFAACGWLQVYLFGVANAITKEFPNSRIKGLGLEELDEEEEQTEINIDDDDNNSNNRDNEQQINTEAQQNEKRDDLSMHKVCFAGSSAGSLASAAILLGVDMNDLLQYAVNCVNYYRSSYLHLLELKQFVTNGVDQFAVDVFFKSAANLAGSPSMVAEAASAASAFSSADPSTPAPSSTNNTVNNSSNQTVESLGKKGGWLSPTEYVFPEHIRKQLNARLRVYATALPWCNEVIFGGVPDTDPEAESKKSKYGLRSTSDLEEALTASCMLVPVAGLGFRLKRTGEFVVDGGLANFQPLKGQRGVITVSAMYFQASDIAPSHFVPAWWGLYPPEEKAYRALFALGHNDALNFLWKSGVLTKPESEEEQRKKKLHFDPSAMPTSRRDTFLSKVLDVLAFFFFGGIMRPVALLCVYAELWFVLCLAFCATVLHDFFPRSFNFLIGTKSLRNLIPDSGRKEAAKDFSACLRNLISPKTWIHVATGYRANVNMRRLARYSRSYRVLQPFITGAHEPGSATALRKGKDG